MAKRTWIILVTAFVLLLGIVLSCSRGDGQGVQNAGEAAEGDQIQSLDGGDLADLRGVDLLLALETPATLPDGVPHLPKDSPGLDLLDIGKGSAALSQDKTIGQRSFEEKLADYVSDPPESYEISEGVFIQLPRYDEDFWVQKRVKELGYESVEMLCRGIRAELDVIESRFGLARDVELITSAQSLEDRHVSNEGSLTEYEKAFMDLFSFYLFAEPLPSQFPIKKEQEV